MRVLTALDVSKQCTAIVDEAASRPSPAGTVFLLLHVLDPFPFAKAPISLKRAKEAAAVQLRSASQSLVEASWKTEADVILGMPRRAVSQIAAYWKADLVIVGSNELCGGRSAMVVPTATSTAIHCAFSMSGSFQVEQRFVGVVNALARKKPFPMRYRFQFVSLPVGHLGNGINLHSSHKHSLIYNVIRIFGAI
jgi:nucleotide-binding universal stress UspA family protein